MFVTMEFRTFLSYLLLSKKMKVEYTQLLFYLLLYVGVKPGLSR
jgi:hypothetical protein